MRLLSILIAATALAVATSTASAATLHDQLDQAASGSGSSTSSYFYEMGDVEQAADDFTVPVGQLWLPTGAQVPGAGFAGTLDFRITLYSDAGGRPGGQVFQALANVPADATTYTFPLNGAPPLLPGHYWLSVQVMNLATWQWVNRTVQNDSPAMWQEPAGTECTSWAPRTTCQPNTSAFPDQAFSLLGDATPLPHKKKCKKHKKHKRSAESAKKKKCKKKKKR
jgi:hypothetical protein